MTATIERRAARRMLHRSRSVWVSVALSVAVVLAAAALVEAVLMATGMDPLLVSYPQARDALSGGGWLGIVIAAVAGILGILCLWGALAPGRSGRRIIDGERVPIVVDDALVAGAISRGAARRAGVASGQVGTRIGRRRAQVDITPSTGFRVAADEVERTETTALAPLALTPPVAVRVRVTQKGALS